MRRLTACVQAQTSASPPPVRLNHLDQHGQLTIKKVTQVFERFWLTVFNGNQNLDGEVNYYTLERIYAGETQSWSGARRGRA